MPVALYVALLSDNNKANGIVCLSVGSSGLVVCVYVCLTLLFFCLCVRSFRRSFVRQFGRSNRSIDRSVGQSVGLNIEL